MKTTKAKTKTRNEEDMAHLNEAIEALGAIFPRVFDKIAADSAAARNDLAVQVDGGGINIEEHVCSDGVDDDGTEWEACSISFDCAGETRLLLRLYHDHDLGRLAACCLDIIRHRANTRERRRQARAAEAVLAQ